MAESSKLGESSSASTNEEVHEEDSTNVIELVKKGFEVLKPTIRASNSLPKGQQRDLFCTSPLFKPTMDSLGKKALDLMSLILRHQGMNRDISKRDLEEKYELMVEANDKILERVDCHLDELSGIRRNPSESIPVSPVCTASGSWNKDVANSARWKEVQISKNIQSPVLINARVTQRPQVKFQDKIDNSSTPFEPRIKEKPNALKPLAILVESLPNEDSCYSHPYEYELDRFQERIYKLNLERKHPQQPKSIEETPLLMITQESHLMEMLEDLRTQTEIAVDLEHHSYRSFQGFTCLMQISTREKDYLIDTLELRHKLYVLNEVFTDPKIVKVFHGADSDIPWLQRDLCLYVVNMFDTYQAALMLSLPRLSLAYLLKSMCNVDANKTFQLYDWRTRPLAQAAIKYAREDTHYLLYIYDLLWNRLLEKSNGGTQMLESVLFRSADTCKRRYWKTIFKEDSYEGMYQKSKKKFDNRQMFALKELYAWRDKTAREEDESVGYVLPNHMLLLIAEKLPKEMQGILACCTPVPPLVRQNVVLLHQIVLKARDQPLVVKLNTTISNESRVRSTPQTNLNLESALHCPHDLTHNVDFRDNLPTLLNNNDVDMDSCNIDLLEKKPGLHIFEKLDEAEDNSPTKMNLPNQIHFMSPFERLKKMLKYNEAEEQKSKEDKEKEILQDTQKLLDECMRERLKQQSTSNSLDSSSTSIEPVHIKEESQECQNLQTRKRPRSPTNGERMDESTVSVKTETTEKSNKNLNNDSHPCNPSCSPKKKKGNVENTVVPMDVGTKRKTKDFTGVPQKKKKSLDEEFTQYDYSQVDYSQFQNSSSFANNPKRSHDKFKHKGKKKQQNKTFTFARNYGSGNSSK